MSVMDAARNRDPFFTPNAQGPLGMSRTARQIWAIGGGKGGVGKSLVSSSFAVSLARTGRRVTAIDLDLGGANLHTALGVEQPGKTLSDFVSGRASSLLDCALPTSLPRVSLISGAQDSTRIANLTAADRERLMQQIWQLDTDYILLDLGAGTNESTLDFFNAADLGMCVLLPEPTSIENAYRFIKSCYYRKLIQTPGLAPVQDLIQTAMDGRSGAIRTPAELFRAVSDRSLEFQEPFIRVVESFRFKIIVNQARTQSDTDLGASVKTICKKYFGINVEYLGSLDYDSSVWQAVRRKRPAMVEFPNSQLVAAIERMTQHLLKQSELAGTAAELSPYAP